ncbi:MAG: hypothetical protein IH840_06065 [Candidatus Heimdallarchaeota archaeon]|nr:hypothetical protein [Candidatus Heimdallarchaeota archaeon]
MVKDLAQHREDLAEKLSQEQIWEEVIHNAVGLDAPAEMKAEILLGAITDLGVIFRHLKKANRKSTISNYDYAKMLEVCLEKVEQRRIPVDFNPLELKD